MPLTRRCSLSSGKSQEQTSPVSRGRQQPRQNTGSQERTKWSKDDLILDTKQIPDGSSLNHMVVSGRPRRQVSYNKPVASKNKSRNQSKEPAGDCPGVASGDKKLVASQRKQTEDKMRKRPAEDPKDISVKRPYRTPRKKDGNESQQQIVSPRRSSRTSVPNRRYKDMDDILPFRHKKSEPKVKERKLKKRKGEFATGIKVNETDSEAEDIVTEEIPLDTSQAMDAMASSNNEISIDATQTISKLTNSGNDLETSQAMVNIDIIGSEANVNDSQSADGVASSIKMISQEAVKTEFEFIVPGDNVDSENSRADKEQWTIQRNLDKHVAKAISKMGEAKVLSADMNTSLLKQTVSSKVKTVKPKVIVIDPATDNKVSSGISGRKLPVDQMKTKQPAPVVGGRLLEINASSLKNICTGQVVHVPTVKDVQIDRNKLIDRKLLFENKFAQKNTLQNSSDTEKHSDPLTNKSERKAEASFEATSVNKRDNKFSQAINDDTETTNPISGSGITSQSNTNRDEVSSGAETRDIVIGVKSIKKSPIEKDEDFDSDLARTISAALGHTVQLIKVPVKDKTKEAFDQNNDRNLIPKESDKTGDEEITHEKTTESENFIQNSSLGTETECGPPHSQYPVADIDNDGDTKAAASSEVTENIEYLSVATDVAEPYTIEVSDKEYFVGSDLTAQTDAASSKDNTSKSLLQLSEGENSLQTAFCEVVEYDGKKKAVPQQVPVQSAFDYIMFGDNIVEIRKPQPLHGRIQPVKPADKESNTGKVEFVVIHEPESSQPRSYNSSFSTDEDMKTQHTQTAVKVITPVNSGDQPPKPTQFTTHGHIIRLDPNSPPTDVVEVSEDMFQKEVYDEDVTLETNKGESLTEFITIPAIQQQREEQNTDSIKEISNKTSSVTSVDQSASMNAETVQRTSGTQIEIIQVKAKQSYSDSDQQVELTQKIAPVKKGRTVGGKIIVVGKEYFKDKEDTSSALQYQTSTMKQTKSITAGSSLSGTAESGGNEVVTGEEEANSENLMPDTKHTSTHNEDNIIVVHPETVKPIYSEGRRLATAGTQTPVTTKTVDIHVESKASESEVDFSDSEKQHTEQYIIVHLPEGTEIKQKEVKTPVNYKQYNETEITMLENGQFVCVDCHYVTSKRSNWFKHRRKHLGIKPHQCPFCSYKAATSSNLKRHIGIHQDIRDFICPICAMAFRQKIHLERHLKYRHEEKKVKCPLCEYTCANENPDLKIHIKRRHMPLPDGSVLPFTCDECGIMTVSKKDLRQHKKFHKKGPELKLFCEFCSFVTDCESRLKRHMYIHTKEKPFQCGLCAYRATQKEHVLRHMKTQHDIEVMKKKKSLLPKKDKEDTDSGDSESDTRNPFEQADYSSTDRIFACNHCTMRFAKLINLYKHLYSQHKSLMPDPGASDFQCVVCEFRTNNKKNLLVHMRKHNMQDQTPPSHVYSCVLCRYINPRRKNLFQHMKKKHGIEIMVKEDGSTNCLLSTENSPIVLGREEGDTNVMSLSDIVTTHSIDDNGLRIVSDDSTSNSVQIISEDKLNSAANVSIENVINIEDISSYVVNSTIQDIHVGSDSSPVNAVSNIQIQTGFPASIAEHEAAEAIEGLQALAQQTGMLETQVIETVDDSDLVTGSIMDTEQEIISKSQETASQQELMPEAQEVISHQEVMSVPQGGEVDGGIQLSSDQINQLSTGDYVEINGEVYKVEISSDNPVLSK